ncbi:hypothetical protein EDE12_11740 [Methylosinus sp. sav-2]|nr:MULTISPECIES: hypothetical protein [unclassified Methylosinus]TDX60926.1 hypothetical protein EDE12_11740 [Methylosinus sp. sav-2]
MNLSIIMMIQPLVEKADGILQLLANGLVVVDLAGFLLILGALVFELF